MGDDSPLLRLVLDGISLVASRVLIATPFLVRFQLYLPSPVQSNLDPVGVVTFPFYKDAKQKGKETLYNPIGYFTSLVRQEVKCLVVALQEGSHLCAYSLGHPSPFIRMRPRFRSLPFPFGHLPPSLLPSLLSFFLLVEIDQALRIAVT